MGDIIGMKLLWHVHRLCNHLNSEAWVQIPNGVDLRCERRSKCTILELFLRILKSLMEVKLTIYIETKKIFELNILPTH